ncbi:MAG TPA: erythromycin esterase family protein [Chitinophagaceae bacterium]
MHAFKSRPKLDEQEVVFNLQQLSCPLEKAADLDPLLKRIGDARIVMLGEATHGSHEFYNWRAHITRRLIEEKGFSFVAVEGDWPDCYKVNRYVKNYPGSGDNIQQVLKQFNRWPTWMWANWEMMAFCEWLRDHNRLLTSAEKTGFYGLDVYSLYESLEAIVDFLKKTDRDALKKAEAAMRCFEPYRDDEGISYARNAEIVSEHCETVVLNLLREIRNRLGSYDQDYEGAFSTYQNALVAVNAEKYYRSMLKGGPHAWNIRDRHMADSLSSLLDFYGDDSKAVVWAHNAHIGDARATDMRDAGMYNLGELVRLEHHESGTVLVGFGTYEGNTFAARRWGGPMRKTTIPPAKKGSWEHYLHQASAGDKLLLMDDFLIDIYLENQFDHRGIGVVYNPQYDLISNYNPTVLPLRYDAFIFLDRTSAIHPLHLKPDGEQVPETYPFGF